MQTVSTFDKTLLFVLDAVCYQRQWSIYIPVVRNCSEKYSPYGKQLGGFEYKDENEAGIIRSKWRTPFIERKNHFRSKLSVFATKKFTADIVRYNPDNWKFMSFANWWQQLAKKKLIYEQRFIEERLNILGCDLTAAHFVVFRGGSVKFLGDEIWIKDSKTKKEYDDDLPNKYDPSYIVEAIDMSKTRILYEGLTNLENLDNIKWLSFAYCVFFDNWCFDRISTQFGHTVEYLDVSYTNITYHAFSALYRFQNLKTLKVSGFSDDPDFLLACLEIKKSFPYINIEGVEEIPEEGLPIIHPDFADKSNISMRILEKVLRWLASR